MKTLTITISDEAAENLARAVENGPHTAEQVASQTLEDRFAPDWFDELDDEAQAAILQGVQEADRGEFATDAEVEEVFSRFKR